MSGAHTEPTEPRIVKKKKVAGGGAHGGAWKVAYADFVTAMMALFIVLWIMSQSQSIRQNVAQYFKNPGLLPGATGLMETSDLGGELPTPGHSQELQRPAPIKPDLSCDRSTLEEARKRITELIAQLPELSRLKDQVALEFTQEGLRIELLDKENSHFFEIGSAKVKPETQELLKLIAKELGKLPNQLTVEGHTDSRPYGTKDYTNWELSADRANAARHLMDEDGIRPGQVISVMGCADRQLRNPADPLDFQNRRVSILVRFQGDSREAPLDMQKLEGSPQKTPEHSGVSTSPSTPAPEVPKNVASPQPVAPPVKNSPHPVGVNSAEAPHPQSTAPGTVAVAEPKPAAPTPAPAAKSTLPSTVRLDDKVQEEVRQMLLDEGVPDPPPQSTGANKVPRQRLGW
jgi:chemotaxis protein MotB